MNHPEDSLQIACADYCRRVLHPSVIWHHSVNEGKRGKAAAGLAKAMGQRAGWPDFIFIWNTNGGVGFVELKSEEGRLSDAQKAFRNSADNIDVNWAVCRSADEFIATLKTWGIPTKANTPLKIGAQP